MKKILHFISLWICVFAVACSEDETAPFDGSTSLDEVIDYSSFKAEVSDTYAEREISTRALSNHIGFANKSNPALSVVFDDKEVGYEYDLPTTSYSLLAGYAAGQKAQYMFSSEERADGAIVAALWPSESLTQSTTAIQLRNMKSRISVSFEYESSDATNVEQVKIGQLAVQGEFVYGSTLQYATKADSEIEDVVATQVTTKIEAKAGYKVGTYEAFVIPQTIDQYADYVAFTIDGVENKYYFKRPFVVEPHTLYNMTFSVRKVNNAVEIDVISQQSIEDYDQGGNHTIAVNPSQPVIDRWDGETYATSFAEGDGSTSNPYLISNAAELALLMKNKNEAAYLNKSYKLMINIDWDNRIWEPLAPNYDKEFTGVFDGNNKVIKNLSISYKYNMGAFIARLGNQTGSTIVSKSYGAVRNLTINAAIKFDSSEGQKGENFGGIVGMVNGGSTVEFCSFTGSVEGAYKVGGIAGACDGEIIGCTVSNATITATSESEVVAQRASAGGIAGRVGNATATPGARIQYCLSQNNTVSGHKDHTAGIVGGPATQYPNIAKCYVSGLQTSNANSYIFGVAGNEQTTNKAVVDNWVITNFCTSIIDIVDSNRKSTFTTSSAMASQLNNASIIPANQTLENNWTWIVNPAGETFTPTPSRGI